MHCNRGIIMEVFNLEALLKYISNEAGKELRIDVSALALLRPQRNELSVLLSNGDNGFKKMSIPDASFHAFNLMDGKIILETKQPEHDGGIYLNHLLENGNHKISRSIVIPISHEALGHGALLLGSYDAKFQLTKQQLHRLDLNALLSRMQPIDWQETGASVRTGEDANDYEALFDRAAKPMAIIGPGGEMIRVNRAFERLAGHERSRIENRLSKFHDLDVEIMEWRDKFSIINTFITGIHAHADLDSLMKSFIEKMNDIFDFQLIGVMLQDTAESRLHVYVSKDDGGLSYRSEGDEIRKAIMDQLSPMLTVERKADLLFRILKSPVPGALQSTLCFPLRVDEKCVGGLCIASMARNAFSAFHVDMFQVIANQLAVALSKILLLRHYQQSIRHYSSLQHIGATFNASLNLEIVKKAIAKTCAEIFGARTCSIHFTTAKDGQLNPFPEQQRQDGENFTPHRFPIGLKSEPHAVLVLHFIGEHQLTVAELELLKILCQQAALAIDNARLFAASEKSRYLLEQSLTRAADAILLTSADGNITFANESARQLLGYGQEEIIGRPIHRIMLNGAVLFPRLKENILRHRQIHDMDAELLKKDGSFISMNWSVSLVSDEEAVYLWTGKDNSLHKNREKELREKREELENQLQTITHQLKSPLASQESFISLIEDQYADQLDAECRHYLDRIRKNAEHMRSMVNGLLNSYRFRKPREVVESVEIENVLKALVQELDVMDRVELTYPENLPSVYMDQEELRTIFENLIINSVKYSGNGIRPKIEIGFQVEENRYHFYVKDNGMGIHINHLNHIFDDFYRPGEVQGVDGHGLGLSIVKRIVENHGGEIGIDSAPGRGTVVHFKIPIERLNMN